MIWLPGVLSQCGEKFTWGRYSLKSAVVEGERSSFNINTGYTTAYTKGYVFHEDTGLFDLDSSSHVNGETADYVSMGVGTVVYSPYKDNNLFYGFQLTGYSGIYKKTISKITTSGDTSTIYFDVVQLKAGNVRGEYIDTVEAAEGTYPDNGQQGDYWYVRYADTPITWERYEFSWVEVKGASVTQSVSSSTTFYRATTYRIEDGLFKASGTSTRASSLSANNNYLIQNNGAFVNSTNLSGDTLCKITSKSGYSTVSLKYDTFTLAEEKGNYVDIVTSYNPTEYPDNGKQDGYWYVKVETGSVSNGIATFVIQNFDSNGATVTATCPVGTTWAEFIESDDNTISLYIGSLGGEEYVCPRSGGIIYVGGSPTNSVLPSDIIDPTLYYRVY